MLDEGRMDGWMEGGAEERKKRWMGMRGKGYGALGRDRWIMEKGFRGYVILA